MWLRGLSLIGQTTPEPDLVSTSGGIVEGSTRFLWESNPG
jgi:hypothetical protein